jgi:conjugative transfer signal peptidase TraF
MTVSTPFCNSLMRRRRRVVAWFAGTALIVLTSIVALGHAGYRVNFTPSEPLGLWRISKLDRPLQVGDLVFVCPPSTDVMRIARERGYLRIGLCIGGTAPLIKTVAAMPGQMVSVDENVHLDGQLLPHSLVASVDGQGRKIAAYGGGVIALKTIYLHSDFQGSFDSRYFGPVPVDGVLGLAREVWTYAP